MKTPLMAALALFGLVSCAEEQQSEVISQKFIHKYGFAVSEKEWSDRSAEGTVISTLDNGTTVTQNFVNGVLNGETTYSFPNSPLIQERLFYTGGSLTKKVFYDTNTIPLREESYELDRMVITSWDQEGAPLRLETYGQDLLISGTYYNKNNEVESRVEKGDGVRTVRSLDGKLLSKDTIDHGKMVSRVLYHPNGSIEAQLSYSDYKLDGETVKLSPSGNPLVKIGWKKNSLHGLNVTYKNGFKLKEIPYAEGKKEGVEKIYDESGKLIAETPWKNGRKHGCVTEFLGENDTEISWYFRGRNLSPVRYKELEAREKMMAGFYKEEAAPKSVE